MGQAIALLVLTLALTACRRTEAPRETPSAPEQAAPRDPVEAAEPSVPAPTEDPASWEGAPPPSVDLDDQPCAAHDECRVFQPSDWNPRVECCYEYSCDLDYVAINDGTWDRIRAWQQANPFDCVAHLGEAGPCSARTPRCGLIQDAPTAACIDNQCVATLPEPWPAADPEAQRCTSDAECLAYRPASTSDLGRCCGLACEGFDWIAINDTTAEEVDRWLRNHAPSCEDYLAEQPCDLMGACALRPPSTRCRGGVCVIDE